MVHSVENGRPLHSFISNCEGGKELQKSGIISASSCVNKHLHLTGTLEQNCAMTL